MIKFKNTQEFKNYIKSNNDCPDICFIGNKCWTMLMYDWDGKVITYKNDTDTRELILNTFDRYTYGFKDLSIKNILN